MHKISKRRRCPLIILLFKTKNAPSSPLPEGAFAFNVDYYTPDFGACQPPFSHFFAECEKMLLTKRERRCIIHAMIKDAHFLTGAILCENGRFLFFFEER